MTAWIAAEIVIKIGVRIEMQDLDRPRAGRGGRDERKADRMIAAERERHLAILIQHRDMAPNRGIVLRSIFGERQVAIVGESDVDTYLRPKLARHIAALAPQHRTNCGGTFRGAALEAAVDVGGKTEEADRRHAPLVISCRCRARRNCGRPRVHPAGRRHLPWAVAQHLKESLSSSSRAKHYGGAAGRADARSGDASSKFRSMRRVCGKERLA